MEPMPSVGSFDVVELLDPKSKQKSCSEPDGLFLLFVEYKWRQSACWVRATCLIAQVQGKFTLHTLNSGVGGPFLLYDATVVIARIGLKYSHTIINVTIETLNNIDYTRAQFTELSFKT